MKDFKKNKVKLGRSLKPANNKTDTTFKTKKINVPTQSLKRNVQDLLNKSSLNRKELLELLDLKENQSLIWKSLLNLLFGDASKRKVLLNSWKEILEKLDPEPFLGLIITHLNCALCHVDQWIRLDALGILESTSLSSASHEILEKLLNNLLEMLDQKSSSARLSVLSQIYKILQLILASSLGISTSGLDLNLPSSQQTRPYDGGTEAHPYTKSTAQNSVFPIFKGYGLNEKSNVGASRANEKINEVQEKLLPFLVNYWIESAVVLEKEIIQDSTDLMVSHTILKIMGILGSKGSNEDTRLKISFEKFKGFPFGRDKVKESEIIKEMNWDYSIVSCKVKVETHITHVVKYVLEFLKESSGEHLELDKIDGMFQVIWEILKNSLIRERVDILEKLTRFKVVDRSNVLYKKKFEFLSYVIKEIDEHRLDQNLRQNDKLMEEFKKWIFSMPRKLWELKINNMELTKEILEFLVYILQNNTINICKDGGLEKFQLSMIPLFHVISPKGDIFGPFKSYSLDCQQLLLNLLFYLPDIQQKLLVSIVSCLTNLYVNVETVAHFMDIIYTRQVKSIFPLEKHVYASVCTTLLVGYSSKEMKELQNRIAHPQLGFYGLDECLALKSSKLSKKAMISKEEYISSRVCVSKRILYAFRPFLGELPSIIDGIAVSPLPLDTLLCFCLALSNFESMNAVKFEHMIKSFINDDELKNILITECPGNYDHFLFFNRRDESSL